MRQLKRDAEPGEYDQGHIVAVHYDDLIDVLEALGFFLSEPGCGDGCGGCIFCRNSWNITRPESVRLADTREPKE